MLFGVCWGVVILISAIASKIAKYIYIYVCVCVCDYVYMCMLSKNTIRTAQDIAATSSLY